MNRSIITNKPSAIIPFLSVSSSGSLTDINKLLDEILKPKKSAITERSYQDYMAQTVAYQSLKHQCEQQAGQIEKLQQKVAELRPLSAIGEAHLNKCQSSRSTVEVNSSFTRTELSISLTQVEATESYQSLEQKSVEQKKAIASLQQQIAQLQATATIGEFRLNKWRNRKFSG